MKLRGRELAIRKFLIGAAGETTVERVIIID